MTVFPSLRLLYGSAVLVAAALVVVVVPATWVLLLLAWLGFAGLCSVDLWLALSEGALQVRRRLPERAFLTRVTTIEVVVSNPTDRRIRAELLDEVPHDLLVTDPQRVVAVEAGASTIVRYHVRPTARGDRALGTLWVWVESPLHLWRRRLSVAPGEVLRVYPDTASYLRGASLEPHKIFQSLGAKPAPQRGDGFEFESLRDYVPGDDPRRVDWAASARRGRPITKLFQHERNHVVLIAVDSSRLMAGRVGDHTKLDYAIDAALALAHASLVSADRVGMAVFDDQMRGLLAPPAQRGSFGRFVDLLRPLQPRLVEANYRGLVQNLTAHQRQRALVIILTDFVEAASSALAGPLAALARRHRVLLVAIRDRLYDEVDSGARRAQGEVGRLPVDSDVGGVYRRIVLNDLLNDREVALASLRQAGVQTLDLVPEAVRAEVLNRYLAIRFGPEW